MQTLEEIRLIRSPYQRSLAAMRYCLESRPGEAITQGDILQAGGDARTLRTRGEELRTAAAALARPARRAA